LSIPDDTLYMWTILAVVLMMSVLVFNINRQYEVEKELAKLKSEQAELLERDYTAVNRAYQVNAKLFHDLHNHIGVLRQFLAHEKYGEAIRYLDELQAPVRNLTATVWTGDETADYLINSKAAAAEADGIRFQVQVEFPRRTNIRSVDLCAILGNLLDNAIEAARQVPDPSGRTVALTIRRIHQMLVIKVENSFSSVSVQENGELKTTKTEGGLHGWGLKSAQTAAEKYDGMVQAGVCGEVFRAVATLSYQGMEDIHE
jgi:sensor histidine kinase regulating citrate/malate metabolism